MSAVIGALRGVLSLNSAAFERGAKRAEASMNGMQRRMAQTSANMTKLGKRLSLGITVPMIAIGTVTVKRSLDAIDAQAKLAQSLGTTVKSMQVLERAGELAGVSMGEISSISQDMTRRLSKAASGAGPAAKALDRLGLSASDLVKLPLDQRILEINTAIADMIPAAERAAVAGDLFGRTGAIAIARMDTATLRTAAADVDRFGIALSETQADGIEEANDALSRLALIGKGLGNQLTASLAPVLKTLADRAAGLSDWFNGLSDNTKRFVGVGALVAGVAGPAAVALGLMTAALIPLATPIGAVVLGLAGLAAGAAYVAVKWDDLIGRFPVLQRVASALSGVWDGLKAVWGATWTVLSEQASLGVTAVSSLLQGDFTGALSAVGEMATKNIEFLVSAFSGLWDAVGPSLEQFSVDVVAWHVALPQKIAAGLGDLAAFIGARFSGLSAAVGAQLAVVAEDAFAGAQAIAARVFEGLAALPDLAAVAIKNMAARLWVELKDVAAAALSEAKKIGQYLIEGITAGIDAKWQDLKAKVRGIADFVPNWLRSDLKIKSPSRVTKEIGGYVVDGLIVGMSAGQGGLAATAADLAGSVTSVFDTMAGDISKIVGDLFAGLGGGAAGAIASIKSALQRGLSSAISGPLQSALSGGQSVGGAAPQAGGGLASGGGLLSGMLGSFGQGGSILGLGGLGGGTGLLGGLGNALSGGLANVFNIAGNAAGGLMGTIGAAIPVLGIAAAAFSFFRKKVKQLDSGLRVSVDGMSALVETFNKTETKRFWGLSKKVRETFAAASDAVADPIKGIVSNIQKGVLGAALALGVGSSAFADFAHEMKISTQGMGQEEAQAAVRDALQDLGDDFAAMVPDLEKYTGAGEGALAAVERLATGLTAANGAMDTLGHRLFAVSVAGGDAASGLVELFGGLDAFSGSVSAYFQNFYSESERFDVALRQISERFADLGQAVPRSRTEFRAMVEGIDTATASGREMYAALVSMSGALSAVLPAVESFTLEIAAMVGVVSSEISDLIGETSAAAQASAAAASQWYKTAQTLRGFVADMRGVSGLLVSAGQAQAFNEARYQVTLAAAMTGDNDAARQITGIAGKLLDSAREQARTALDAARVEARVISDLSLLGGVSDIEGARHDVVSGLLGQQVDLLEGVRDVLGSGAQLDAAQLEGLSGAMGALQDAIGAAEMINYAFLKERLNVSVDLLASASLPDDVRALIANAQTGVSGSIDFVVRSDLSPDLKWLALTGVSEHIKTVKFLVDNSQWSQAAQNVALTAGGAYTQTVRFLAQNTMPADLTGLALGDASTLLKSIKFTAQALPEDVRAIVFDQIGPLQKRIDFMLGDNIPDHLQTLALDDAATFTRVINTVAGRVLHKKLQTLALSDPQGFVRHLNVVAGAVPSGRVQSLALDAAKQFTRQINLKAGKSVSSVTARLALDSVGALNRTINLLSGADLSPELRRIALAGNSELSRVVNVSLSSGASAEAVKLALGNVGAYAVAVRASLDAPASVREIVFGDAGSYAAMIEAAFAPDLSDAARRVLLTRQGGYVVNIVGALASGASEAMQSLLLKANTTAIRGVTVAMTFAGNVSAAERALLLTQSMDLLRTIKAGVNPAGLSPFDLLYLDQLYAGGGTVGRGLRGGVDMSGVVRTGRDYFNILSAGAGSVSRILKGAVDLGALNPSQLALLNAVQGNSTGTLRLGGSFTFNAAAGFQSWFGDTTVANISAPMAGLMGSLDALAGVISREARISEASGFASKLVNAGNGQFIATDKQITKLAQIMGIDTKQPQAALRSQIPGFSAGDSINSVSAYTTQMRDFLLSQVGTAGLQVNPAEYKKALPALKNDPVYADDPQGHWDRWGARMLSVGDFKKKFNPRLFDWSSIGLQVPAFANGGVHRGGLARIGENDMELVAPSRIYNPAETRKMLAGDGGATARSVAALTATVAQGIAQDRAVARRMISALQRSAEILEKFEYDGMPEVRT